MTERPKVQVDADWYEFTPAGIALVRDAAEQQPCPSCEAPAGLPCNLATPQGFGVHQARIQAVLDELRKGDDV